jgi:hypothetical protein
MDEIVQRLKGARTPKAKRVRILSAPSEISWAERKKIERLGIEAGLAWDIAVAERKLKIMKEALEALKSGIPLEEITSQEIVQ